MAGDLKLLTGARSKKLSNKEVDLFGLPHKGAEPGWRTAGEWLRENSRRRGTWQNHGERTRP